MSQPNIDYMMNGMCFPAYRIPNSQLYICKTA